MGNNIPSTTDNSGDTVTFTCQTTGERLAISWSLLASRFKRFEDEVHKGTSVGTNLPINSFKRLSRTLETPGSEVMNGGDIELLNWLQLKDFTDAYKLYVGSPLPPPVPSFSKTYAEDDGGIGRVRTV